MTTPSMTNLDRLLRTLRYEPVDRRPMYLSMPWRDTLARWRREGLPEGTDPHEFLGIKEFGYPTANITAAGGIYPPFTEKVLREDGDSVYRIDSYGRTVRELKNQTSMPEWVEFPVKGPADLRRLMDEHFDVANLDARFPADWEEKARAAAARQDVIMIDGGCYYFTLSNVAGVEGASYLLYDAPELVDELFERYLTVVMEGLKRAIRIVPVDLIGFAEDIAFKTGPLVAPETFRRFFLPRYRKVMDFAHAHGIEFTLFDSDGDLRTFIPELLAVGINNIWPCEVAANMSPAELRPKFGRELRLSAGFDKRAVARGPRAIEAELTRLLPLIREGGYVPGIDHTVSADISWDNYRYYIDALRRAVIL